MSGIRLTYFDGRGRAELSRLVLAAAGQKYEDVRLTFEQWGGGEKAKARFNGLPNLLYKGKTYGQSMAIAAFLGKEFGLYGKSNEEALRIDEVMQIIVDIRTALMNANFEKDPAKKEELLKKCKESLPRNLKYLEEVAVANGKKGFFLNAKLSIADLALFDAWVSVKNAMPEADTGKDYPELKKILRSVETTATIKTYLANRKETSF